MLERKNQVETEGHGLGNFDMDSEKQNSLSTDIDIVLCCSHNLH